MAEKMEDITDKTTRFLHTAAQLEIERLEIENRVLRTALEDTQRGLQSIIPYASRDIIAVCNALLESNAKVLARATTP